MKAAYDTVIYKEGRDIVEPPERPYAECSEELEAARREFRQLNRELRAASFDLVVDFQDE